MPVEQGSDLVQVYLTRGWQMVLPQQCASSRASTRLIFGCSLTTLYCWSAKACPVNLRATCSGWTTAPARKMMSTAGGRGRGRRKRRRFSHV